MGLNIMQHHTIGKHAFAVLLHSGGRERETERVQKSTFQLDSIHTAFLHHAHGILDCLLRGGLVAAERQITHKERPAWHCRSQSDQTVIGR